MWRNIEKTVDRAVSGIVYGIWGGVGISTSYDEESKEIHLIVWDKSYASNDKNQVVNKKFKFDLNSMTEFEAKYDVIACIERYLLENYS